MKDLNHTQPNHKNPPIVAVSLLNFIVPKAQQDCIIGDLIEEFQSKAKQNTAQANRWFWRQTLGNVSFYSKSYLKSSVFLYNSFTVVSGIIFAILTLFINWLSNMDKVEPEIWAKLLDGKVLQLLFEPSVLQLGYDKFTTDINLPMYLNTPAICWSMLSLFLIYLLNRKIPLSPHQLAGLGVTLMIIPYILGYFYIQFYQPPPIEVGPILAVMVFPIIYSVIPLCAWVISCTKKASSI